MYICSTKEDNQAYHIFSKDLHPLKEQQSSEQKYHLSALVRLPIKGEKKTLETNFCPFLTLFLLPFFKNKEERLHSLHIRYFFKSGPPKR